LRDPEPSFADVVADVLSPLRPGGLKLDGRELWRVLGRTGALAELYADLPTSAGTPSLQLDFAKMRLLLEGLDDRCEIGVVLAVCVQAAAAIPLLAEHPGGPHETVLRAALAGTTTVAVAATDVVGAGSDLAGMATSASIDDDEVVLTGGKRWITGAAYAEHILVLARHRPGRHFTNFTLVLVPADTPGLTVVATDTPYFQGAGIAEVAFDQVTVGHEYLLGGVGRGLPCFLKHLANERVCSALWATDIARRVLSTTRDHFATRTSGEGLEPDGGALERFGHSLLDYQQLVAMCEQKTPIPGNRISPVAAMLLKAAAGRTLATVLANCAQLQGADAFLAGGLRRLQAEASLFGVAGGTTETMVRGIAEHADELLTRPRRS
jgi:citronellyl-CoA dehydrogenase